jgi:tryptophan synthase alpha chain
LPNQTFAELFAERRREKRLTLLPYLMAGYPSVDATVELLAAMSEAGGDGFELGMPFSDPIADGPTVQRANQRALENGVTPTKTLDLLREARKHVAKPVSLMGYYNPMVRYGVERWCRDAAQAGAQALIVPDVPPEEAEELDAATRAAGLDLVAMVAPTSSPDRVRLASRAARGFIYCVALVGVTGARRDLSSELEALLGSVRSVTTTPVVVGFGISTPQHLTWLRGRSDGAIVASALIDRMDAAGPNAVAAAGDFVRSLRAGADARAEVGATSS